MNFACDLHMRIGYNKKKMIRENSFLYLDSNSTQCNKRDYSFPKTTSWDLKSQRAIAAKVNYYSVSYGQEMFYMNFIYLLTCD